MDDEGNDILDTIKLFGIFWFAVACPYLLPIAILMMIIYYGVKAIAQVFGRDIKDIETPEKKEKEPKDKGAPLKIKRKGRL